MAFVLNISEVVELATPRNRKLLKQILENMADFVVNGLPLENGLLRSYQEYAPQLDFGMPASKKAIGEALGELWEYCDDCGIPWLNMLVVRKDTQFPGTGIFKWYEGTFNTLTGFEKFCEYHVLLAEHMLTTGCILILK